MKTCLQIEVETVDKTGTFLGSVWEGKENVSASLLEAGLAKLHPMFSTDRTTEGHLLVQAQERAKKQNLKVPFLFLSNWVPCNALHQAFALVMHVNRVQSYGLGNYSEVLSFLLGSLMSLKL